MNAAERPSALERLRSSSSARTLTISIRLAVSALVLTAILLTAAASSLFWWRTAESISRQLASTINEQIVAAVRKEVSAIVDEARAAHTAVRTLFLQNVLDTREADKREFVFLSQLQSQATISWVAFGWPDGSFFAAHKLGDLGEQTFHQVQPAPAGRCEVNVVARMSRQPTSNFRHVLPQKSRKLSR